MTNHIHFLRKFIDLKGKNMKNSPSINESQQNIICFINKLIEQVSTIRLNEIFKRK